MRKLGTDTDDESIFDYNADDLMDEIPDGLEVLRTLLCRLRRNVDPRMHSELLISFLASRVP